MAHEHRHNEESISGRNLFITILLNFGISAAEIIGGIVSNSLSLMSDALHNLSDGIAVVIAYIAFKVAGKESDERKTFGFMRAEIIAAFINSIILVGVSVYLFIEAVDRLMNPEPINGTIMFIVAGIGLAANVTAVLLLKKDSGKNLNVKAAYLHLLGDALSSLAVIVGGALIVFYKIYWVDPVVTILIGLYILKETYYILKQSLDILMQSAPPDIDLQAVRMELEKIPEIESIHHVHLWNLTDKQIHFECHVDLKNNLLVNRTVPIRDCIEERLNEKFGITHVTVQFEFDACHDKEMINCCHEHTHEIHQQ